MVSPSGVRRAHAWGTIGSFDEQKSGTVITVDLKALVGYLI